MAISIGNTSTVGSGAASSGERVIPAPSGIEDNDILVLTFYRYGTYGGVTVPTGFSEPVVGALSSDTIRVCWKRASSESGDYTLTDSYGNLGVASITVVKGCKTTDSPLNVAASNTGYTTNNTTIRAAALSPTAEVALLWAAYVYELGITVPSGFSEQANAMDQSDNRIAVATKVGVSSGSTGDIDGTASASTYYKHAIMLALEAASGAPAPSSSAKYPQTTATTNATAPYDDDNWVNIGNITADDTSYAVITSSSYDANDYSYLAKATNFGFTIPSTATIVGLEVETLSCTNAGMTAAQWAMMQLLNASGTAEGDNKGTGTLNRTTDAVNTFGGPTDKWGVSLTPAMVNDSDFGVQFAVQAKAANTDIRVEYLKMTVYYTAAEGTTLHNLMMMGAGTA